MRTINEDLGHHTCSWSYLKKLLTGEINPKNEIFELYLARLAQIDSSCTLRTIRFRKDLDQSKLLVSYVGQVIKLNVLTHDADDIVG